MGVYVSQLRRCGQDETWPHWMHAVVVADSEEELWEFLAEVGWPRAVATWIRGQWPLIDVGPVGRERALQAGAQLVGDAELKPILDRWTARFPPPPAPRCDDGGLHWASLENSDHFDDSQRP